MVMAGTFSEILTKRDVEVAKENPKCTVVYKLAMTCAEMKLSCKSRCKSGNILKIKVQNGKSPSKIIRSCEDKSSLSLKMKTSKTLRVRVQYSKERKHEKGSKLRMICALQCSRLKNNADSL